MVANVVANPAATAVNGAAPASDAEEITANGFLQALVGLAAGPTPIAVVMPQSKQPKAETEDEMDADAVDPSLLLVLQAQIVPPNAEIKSAAPLANSSTAAAPSDTQPLSAPSDTQPVSAPSATAIEAFNSGPQITEPSVPDIETRSDVENPELQNSDLAKSRMAEADFVQTGLIKPAISNSTGLKADAGAQQEKPDLASLAAFSAGAESKDNGLPIKPQSKPKNDTDAEPLPTFAINKPEPEFKPGAFAPASNTEVAANTGSDAATTASIAQATHSVANNADLKSDADSMTQPHLRSHVGAAAWREELGTQVNLMLDKGQRSASIKLTPEHLGPMEVRIDVNQDRASIWFSAAHSETRVALEQALPQLRELLAAQGMSLSDAGVYREPPREQERSAPSSFASNALIDSNEESNPTVVSRLGLLDTYA